MLNVSKPRSWRQLAATGLVAGAMAVLSSAAFAGECPAGKSVADGAGQKPGATMPKDVTDTVLGSIDLADEAAGLDEHLFRMRRLEIMPGGEVPWHSHGDRPAIIYIVSGVVTEYASDCAVPIMHRAGEVSVETHTVSHWWKNTGPTPVVLISADILHDAEDEHMM